MTPGQCVIAAIVCVVIFGVSMYLWTGDGSDILSIVGILAFMGIFFFWSYCEALERPEQTTVVNTINSDGLAESVILLYKNGKSIREIADPLGLAINEVTEILIDNDAI